MPAPRQNKIRATRPRADVPDRKARLAPNRGRGQSDAPGGSSPREDELSLRSALEYLREGDVFIVHSIDRLTQNVEDLRRVLLALSGRGILVELMDALLARTTQDGEASRLLVKAIGAVAAFHHAWMKEDGGAALPSLQRA